MTDFFDALTKAANSATGEQGTCNGRTAAMKRVCVTGAGGFIGHHLVTYLKQEGYWVRGVDLEVPGVHRGGRRRVRGAGPAPVGRRLQATRGVDQVYALAADMGGMGFISTHHAEILHNNALINLHTLDAARINGVQRYLYSSSACIYPEYRQTETDVMPLKESDAYPAQPQDAYGWEKLFTERLCTYYADEYSMRDTHRPLPQHLRAVRHVRRRPREGAGGDLPQGRAGRGRRRASRSGATASRRGRSATSTTASRASTGIMQSDYAEPLNLGTDEMVSINELADLVAEVAGKRDIGTEARSRARRACAAATPTTRCCARSSAGSRRRRCGTGSAPPTGGSRRG